MAKKKIEGTASWYIDQLDKLFSIYIRSRGYCERCGRRSDELGIRGLQCAHVEGRSNFTLRWDESNALCLCYKCHRYWVHTEPRAFTHWFEMKYPERARYLDENKNRQVHRTLEDYRILYEKYIELTT